MTKHPKTPEPVKQEPKKGRFPIMPYLFLTFMGMATGFAAVNGFIMNSKIDEVNRLLSTFQRIDTVKDESSLGSKIGGNNITAGYNFAKSDEKSNLCIGDLCYKILFVDTEHNTATLSAPIGDKVQCNDGAVLVGGQCIKTIGKAKEECGLICQERERLNDPNLCKQWKTICKDGPVGPQCDVTCTEGAE